MNVSVASVLDAPAERVWAEVKTSQLLAYVAHPLQHFVPVDPPQLPTHWEEGRYRVKLRAFGIVPLGWQDVVISFPLADRPGRRHVRDNGCGALVRRWDHLITIDERADGRTDYRDDVAIEAGVLTGGIVAYARWFYRHRQRRWRRLIANQFDYAR